MRPLPACSLDQPDQRQAHPAAACRRLRPLAANRSRSGSRRHRDALRSPLSGRLARSHSRGGAAMPESIDETRLNDLIGKVIGDLAGAIGVFMAYLGDKGGVFAALDGAGRLTLGPTNMVLELTG